MKKAIFCLIIAATVQSIYSQIDYSKFLPLRVGNAWVYRCLAQGSYCYCSKKIKIKVTGTVVLNNKSYFQTTATHYNISCWQGCFGGGFPWTSNLIRIDSVSYNLLMSTNGGCNYLNYEYLQDSFKARLNDSIRTKCHIEGGEVSYLCIDTTNINIFSQSRRGRSYSSTMFESGYYRRYAYGFGLVSLNYGWVGCYENITLLGCVIDGVVYGDTSTVVGIKQISSEVPKEFSLFQNYPNPFNPVTKIRFDIPQSLLSFGEGHGVRLIIYDILGSEIATLVNEQLKPGMYEVEWDGTNYPSGVYFYTLSAWNFMESKKMIITK